jgi:hypothetical protein
MRKTTTVVAAVLAAALSTLTAGPAAAAVLPPPGSTASAVTTTSKVGRVVVPDGRVTTPDGRVSTTAVRARTSAPHATGLVLPAKRVPAARLLTKRVRGLAAPDTGTYGADAVLPDSVDLAADMPPIGNQGNLGACVTWTINYAIMGYLANRDGATGAPYAPLYSYLRQVGAKAGPSAGTNPGRVLEHTKTLGVDTQDDFWQGTTNYRALPTAAEIANAANYKITGYTNLFNGPNQGAAGEELIKRALADSNPVAIGLPVYSQFDNVGTGIVDTVSGPIRGAHMVAAIGYDAAGVTIQNSWGAGWGNAGRAKLSWNFVQKTVNSAHIVAGLTTPAEETDTKPLVTAMSVKTGNGNGGTAVNLVGGGFARASTVSFGGTDAAFTKSTSHGVTTITATSPEHASGVVDVTVTNPAGASAAATTAKFTYTPPPPSLTGLGVTSGTAAGGETVTITGTKFTGTRQVRFGTVSAPKIKVVSDTRLDVTTPRSLTVGTVDVDVVNAGGTSTRSEASKFTFVAPPVPAVTGLDNTTGFTYGGVPVTVTGTDFTYVSRVLVDGKAVSFTKPTPTTVKFTSPLHLAGTAKVQVGNPWALSTTSAESEFTYQTPPVPAITSLSRGTGPTYLPTPLVITGTGFARTSKVTVEGKPVSFKYVSDTSLTATVPAHSAGTVTVQVITPGGTSAAVDVAKFTYVAPPVPTVTGLSATEALTYVSTPVTITGTDFVVVAKVLVGGKAVSYRRVNDTTVTATFPPATAGIVDVQVITPGGTSAVAADAKFTYVAPPVPAVTDLSVDKGLTYVSTPVVVTGTALTAASRVTVDGASAPFTKVNDTTVKVTMLPRAAGPVHIQVVTPGGTSPQVAEDVFTYEAPPVPVVTSLSPNTGYTVVNTPVTITGTDLTAASKVLVGDKSVSFTRVSATSIRFTAPAHAAGAVPVTVVTPGGTTEGTEFTYEVAPVPAVTSLSATSGEVGAARVVVATGTTLDTVSKVLVGATSVPFTKVDDTTINITLPARATAGTVEITMVGIGGTSAAIEYEYV